MRKDTYTQVHGDVEIVRGNTRMVIYVQNDLNTRVLCRINLTDYMRMCADLKLDYATTLIDAVTAAIVKYKLRGEPK